MIWHMDRQTDGDKAMRAEKDRGRKGGREKMRMGVGGGEVGSREVKRFCTNLVAAHTPGSSGIHLAVANDDVSSCQDPEKQASRTVNTQVTKHHILGLELMSAVSILGVVGGK